MTNIGSNLTGEMTCNLSTSAQLNQTLADSIEEAVAKSDAYFEFIPEIIRESHSCLINTRKILSSLGPDVTSSLTSPSSLSTSTSLKTNPISTIQSLMVSSQTEEALLSGQRHRPIIVVGREGSGKSVLLSQVFNQCSAWLSNECCETVKVVRHIGQSPSSSYTSELIRSLCIDITLAYGFTMRTDIVYELSSLSLWFHDLLKLIENSSPASSFNLVILLDDLHLLKSLQTSAILGWLPWTLPPCVHLICSVTESADAIVSLLKSRINSDNFIRLTPIDTVDTMLSLVDHRLKVINSTNNQSKTSTNLLTLSTNQWSQLREHFESLDQSTNPVTPLYISLLTDSVVISKWLSNAADNNQQPIDQQIPVNIEEIINGIINELQKSFGCQIVDRLLTYLSCTRFGLREEELLDLIIGEGDEETSEALWPDIRRRLSPLIKEYYILGQPYLHLSHQIICETIKHRYIVNNASLKRIHTKLADAFLLGFNEVLQSKDNSSSDILREIDELWYHLLQCLDIYKLKHHALLNIDFMMSAVQSSSISYYRSILEIVRGSIIDWEVDLLYHMTKQSVNTVSQNSDQLSVEILAWLRPFAEAIKDSISGSILHANDNNNNINVNNVSPRSPSNESCENVNNNTTNNSNNTLSPVNRLCESKYLENLVRDTVNWCTKFPGSLLIPINSWLHLPLPMQVSVISCPYPINRATITSDHQNLIFCNEKRLHFFNLASKSLLKSFEGHRETITCLNISSSGRYLVTGSEDTSVILWEIDADGEIECNIRYRLSHHVAGVLCTAITHKEEFILSGSEIGAVCVVRLESGLLIGRLEHHRGMITCINVNSDDDIFATGSTDCSVTIWSLDTFCVLNQIFLPKAILHMDISMDSTFLMLALEDNKIHIRALTTGSEVHILQEHQSNSIISCVKFAEDNSRAILGTGDGKLHIYDVHSAHLIQTLTSHQDMITSMISQPCDKYLVTCGTSKVIIWNFYARRKVDSSLGMSSGLPQTTTADSSSSINLVSEVNSVINNRSAVTRTASTGRSTINLDSVSLNSFSSFSRSSSLKVKKFDHHADPITCLAVSRDGTYAVTGSRDSLVKVWFLLTGETHATLSGHNGPITTVAFSPNGLFCVSGSEDKTVRVWSLTLGLKVFIYSDHTSAISSVFVSPDSRRILSVDAQGFHRLWQADTGNLLIAVPKLINKVTMFGNMVFTVGGKNDNSLRYWSVYEPDFEKSVSHSEAISCFTCTYDCTIIITGSLDMSLKAWEVSTGKLTQVLVGHEEPITCVATAPLVQSMVVSGSQDCNLIVWDAATGNVTFTLSGHTAPIISVQLSIDGRVAISSSEDNTIMVWDTFESGQRIALVDIHSTIASIGISYPLNQIVVQLKNNNLLPIIKFHNNPSKATLLDLPAATPNNEDKLSSHLKGFLTGSSRRLIGRGNLKREQSFDSFCWDQLHRGVIDDFRKISALQAGSASPLGSREHLATTGIIWRGSTQGMGTANDRNSISRLLRLGSKPVGPKQKMLKKQQSMFAFFPEHSSSPAAVPPAPSAAASSLLSGSTGRGGQSALASPITSESIARSIIKTASPVKVAITRGPPSRSQSLEDTQTQVQTAPASSTGSGSLEDTGESGQEKTTQNGSTNSNSTKQCQDNDKFSNSVVCSVS